MYASDIDISLRHVINHNAGINYTCCLQVATVPKEIILDLFKGTHTVSMENELILETKVC